MIPKHIFQTIRAKELLVQDHANNVKAMCEANPDWRCTIVFDEDIPSFIKACYDADTLKAYELIGADYGAARADFFRYLLMYQAGGLYLDIKSSVTCELDAVLAPNEAFVLSHWDNLGNKANPHWQWGMGKEATRLYPRGEFCNWFILAEPKHPFLLAVIETVKARILGYEPKRDGVGTQGVCRTTGSLAYTQAIAPILGAHPHRLVEFSNIGLVYSIFEAKGEPALGHQNHPGHYSKMTSAVVDAHQSVAQTMISEGYADYEFVA